MAWRGWKPIVSTAPSPTDEIYTFACNDAGASFVRFGDGRTGSRLPTGINNLKAKFRTGLGAGGNLAPGRLNNLMTRPLGLQGVHQPCPSSGGEDPEQREDARETRPSQSRHSAVLSRFPTTPTLRAPTRALPRRTRRGENSDALKACF